MRRVCLVTVRKVVCGNRLICSTRRYSSSGRAPTTVNNSGDRLQDSSAVVPDGVMNRGDIQSERKRGSHTHNQEEFELVSQTILPLYTTDPFLKQKAEIIRRANDDKEEPVAPTIDGMFGESKEPTRRSRRPLPKPPTSLIIDKKMYTPEQRYLEEHGEDRRLIDLYFSQDESSKTGDFTFDHERRERMLGRLNKDPVYDELTQEEKLEVQYIMRRIFFKTNTGKSPSEEHSTREEVEAFLVNQINNRIYDDDVDARVFEDTKGQEVLDELSLLHPTKQPMMTDWWETRMELIDDERDSVDSRPHLRSRVQWEMFLLNKLAPKKWTATRLAIKYGLQKARVELILKFKQIYIEYSKKDWWKDTLLQDDEDYDELFRDFGLTSRDPERNLLPGKRATNRVCDEGFTDEDADHAVMSKAYRRGMSLRWPPPEELPKEPPPSLMETARMPAIVNKVHPYHRQADVETRYVFMDSKVHRKKLNNATRFVLKEDRDGTVSHIDWAERQHLLPLFRNPYVSGSRPLAAYRTDFSEEEKAIEDIARNKIHPDEEGSVPHLLKKLGYDAKQYTYHFEDEESKFDPPADTPEMFKNFDFTLVDHAKNLREEMREGRLHDREKELLESIDRDTGGEEKQSSEQEAVQRPDKLPEPILFAKDPDVFNFFATHLPQRLGTWHNAYPDDIKDNERAFIGPPEGGDYKAALAEKIYLKDVERTKKKIAADEANLEALVAREAKRRLQYRMETRKKARNNEELTEEQKEAKEKRWAAQDEAVKKAARRDVVEDIQRRKSIINASQMYNLLDDRQLTEAQKRLKEGINGFADAWKRLEKRGMRSEAAQTQRQTADHERLARINANAVRLREKVLAERQAKKDTAPAKESDS